MCVQVNLGRGASRGVTTRVLGCCRRGLEPYQVGYCKWVDCVGWVEALGVGYKCVRPMLRKLDLVVGVIRTKGWTLGFTAYLPPSRCHRSVWVPMISRN
ncbi:hypothetical protein SDJN03_21594, partial [Cucurbita argyrosperma subsp. sororia]